MWLSCIALLDGNEMRGHTHCAWSGFRIILNSFYINHCCLESVRNIKYFYSYAVFRTYKCSWYISIVDIRPRKKILLHLYMYVNAVTKHAHVWIKNNFFKVTHSHVIDFSKPIIPNIIWKLFKRLIFKIKKQNE